MTQGIIFLSNLFAEDLKERLRLTVLLPPNGSNQTALGLPANIPSGLIRVKPNKLWINDSKTLKTRAMPLEL
jgi:hypothetical protein